MGFRIINIFSNIFKKKESKKLKSRKELQAVIDRLEKELQSLKLQQQIKISQITGKLEKVCWDETFIPMPFNAQDENDQFYHLFNVVDQLESNVYDQIAEFKEENRWLEYKVNHKSKELKENLIIYSQTETALKEQNLALKKLNEELDKFVYSASHDLRAPIASLLGLINIAGKEKSIDVIKEYLQLMANSANKLDSLIRDIINYSWNSRIEVHPESVDCRKLITEIFDSFYYVTRFNSIRKVVEVEGDETLFTDKSRFKMILTNLIGNAVKFTKKTEKSPEINILIQIDAQQANIEIRDNGEGIPSTHIPSIFDMFYKANPNKSGSGLGLYITREALIKLKGSIKVESQVGSHTSFLVIIPNLVNAMQGAIEVHSE